jgi:DNA-directed RNA polymerase alpha subunit
MAELSAPARRALEHEGITTLAKLAKYSERELLALHGFGPATLPTLRKALKASGRAFKHLRARQRGRI